MRPNRRMARMMAPHVATPIELGPLEVAVPGLDELALAPLRAHIAQLEEEMRQPQAET
ncbi:hypothetical protein [Roseomonas populi]|uniref:Uncharacterized protein n=1 Tax=Roseomonas populi TaxID=3121582 RepID=A0ABT1XCJ2_9PROT|nr:hypothetical protein [Roseomonas pecuniae]MCR0985853.1 hypothetical protein [Roseomonas pecuniae]